MAKPVTRVVAAPSPAKTNGKAIPPAKAVAKPARKAAVAPAPMANVVRVTPAIKVAVAPALKPTNGVKSPITKVVASAVTIKPGKARHEKKHPPEPAYRPPLQESVPTDGKPRKNQAGILTRELEHFRDLLLEKRREIVGDMSSMEGEALRSGGGGLSSLPVHMADMGTDNYEQEFTLGLVEKDRNLLREINAALAKVQNGTYGLCEGTGQPISKPRLEAQPWARFSIEWARQLERRRGLR